MKLLTLLYVFCLFYVFIPGNVIKLPIKTSKMNIILIHAFVFSVILSCTYGLVDHVNLIEGMNGEHKHSTVDKRLDALEKLEKKESKPDNVILSKPGEMDNLEKQKNMEKQQYLEKQKNIEKQKMEQQQQQQQIPQKK